MKITVTIDQKTGLLEIISSGGTLSVTQTEAAALYTILRKALGLRGRFLIWRKRKMFIEGGKS